LRAFLSPPRFVFLACVEAAHTEASTLGESAFAPTEL
jgi:hypothetical protein